MDLRDVLADALDRADSQLRATAATGYVFGDLPVALRFEPRALIPALARMIEARRAPAVGRPWSIDVVGADPGRYGGLLPEPSRLRTTVLRSTADIYYLWLDEAGGYATALDRRSRRGLVWFTQPDRIASWHIARPLLHALKGLSLATPWTPVHAAAFAREGRAVLAIGQSGAGKTSMALAGALTGWDYLGDDAVMIRSDPPTVAALYSSCRLRTDMFATFEAAMTASLGNSDDAGEIKAELDVSLLGACRADTAAIAAILVPERAGAPGPVLTPIGRAETVRRMVLAKRQSIAGDEQSSFEKLGALVQAVPCYRFDPGGDPFAAVDALAALLSSRDCRA